MADFRPPYNLNRIRRIFGSCNEGNGDVLIKIYAAKSRLVAACGLLTSSRAFRYLSEFYEFVVGLLSLELAQLHLAV